MAGPSDLSERVCKHKVKIKKIYIEIISFPTNILPSLIIVKEPEGVAQACSVKMLFLEIFQNSQENACARPKPVTLSKKRLLHRCFPINFEKLLRTLFFIEHLCWLMITTDDHNFFS